ncbi:MULTISPECIES: hypothetical protein [Chryseobacterium]|uniref:Class IIb bacteriocin, lactobin A/cerein 7B family n=1 Tax=Chryseobacterium potabilaquae TaxID=2675057 RepID=A0A6N4XAF2_9FLAO|nr:MULTISPECIES: hypothetical protein [Chryseobacterium]CAA7196031.1 hypothetical protein CHRY9293_02171 [Chryseobacterium potabilaquae]
MQIENLKVEALSSQEVKSIEGGFFFTAVKALGKGLFTGFAAGSAAYAYNNYNNGRRRN